MNTDAEWHDFEISVTGLLKAAGLDVKHNIQLDHQQVDIVAERMDFGKRRRFAVECKYYRSLLTKDDIAIIYVKYLTLYENGLIDEILVVSTRGVTSTATAFVVGKRGLRHLTFRELQASVMDFSTYITDLEANYLADGISKYYIAMRGLSEEAEGSFKLVRFVTEWIQDQNDPRPLALLSSYGMGKTTFARHLAFTLTKQWVHEPLARIPILVDLGKISDEQSLEGLLGKLFTSTYRVGNYSFSLFMELNRRGHFVVICDSFDEMKHGISLSAFMRNMEEIKRLDDGNAKLLICGRPSAFLSQQEYRGVMQETVLVGDHWIKHSTFGGFREVALAPLNRKEIAEFLHRYLSHVLSSEEAGVKGAASVLKRMADAESDSLYELARRPVQLKMIATVLPQWNRPLDQLSRTLLYDYFIDLLIERESQKPAREAIPFVERRRFARELAWHMWTSSGKDFIRADEIPESVVSEIRAPHLKDLELLRRELIVACALEVKPPDLLFFPHRSLQEFLVAEKLSELLSQRGTLSMKQMTSALTLEVRDFLEGLTNDATMERWARQILPELLQYQGVFPTQMEELLWGIPDVWALVAAEADSVWPNLFLLRSTLAKKHVDGTASHMYKKDSSAYRLILKGGREIDAVIAMHLFIAGYAGKGIESLTPERGSEFLRGLRDLTNTLISQKSGKRALQILSSMSMYSRSQSIETGTLRSSLVEFYRTTSHLGSMLSGDRLSALYDLESNVAVREIGQYEGIGEILHHVRSHA